MPLAAQVAQGKRLDMQIVQSNTHQAFATSSSSAETQEHAAAIAYEIERANSGDALDVVPESVTLASINAANMLLYSTGVTD